jgi:tetratricopeptide (TPR) repeat protein
MKRKIPVGIFLVLLCCYTAILSVSGQTDSLIEALSIANGNEEVDILNTLSLKYLDISLDTSLIYASKAYKLAQERNYTIGKVISLKQIGNYNLYQNKYSEALHNYDSALVLIKNNEKELTLITLLMNNKGVVYDLMGDFTNALSIYNKALEIRRKINDDKGIAQNLNNISLIYYQKGDYDIAIDYSLQSLKMEEKIGNKEGIGQTYINIATIYAELDQFDQTKKYLELALPILEETGSRNSINVLVDLGVQYILHDQNLKKAEEYLSKALKESLKIQDQSNLTAIYHNLGKIGLIKGEYSQAEKYLEKALILAKENGNKRTRAQACLLMGSIQLKLKNYKRANKYYQECFLISEELGLKLLSSDALKALSELNFEIQKYKEAYNYFLKYADLKDSIFSKEKQKQIAEIQTKYDVEKKENKLALLSKENELQKLQFKQSQTLFLSVLIFLTFSSSLFILLIQRKKLKANNQVLETRQRLMRSQMNPHFIFNSIASIQNYIIKNNSLEASSYLAKFANLMRNILYQSRVEFISLDKEIEMLGDYLKLQELRLNDQLSYSINIDDAIDPETMAVPPLLMQPFIENAIEHGILKKENATGNIILKIFLQGKEIVFEIEDDGIGIKNSAKMKKEEHHSLATEIIKNRLILLSKSYRKKPVFNTVDLNDNFGKTGTKVVVKLPVKYIKE